MEKQKHQLKRELLVKSQASELEFFLSEWHTKLTLSELSKIHKWEFTNMNLDDLDWHIGNLCEEFSKLNLLEKINIFQSICEGNNKLFD